MKMVEMNWQPTERQLRQFGMISLIAVPLAGWLFMHRPMPGTWSSTQGVILGILFMSGLLMAFLSLVSPRLLRWPFLALCLVGLPIGMIVSELVIAAIYFLVFTPMALLFKLIGRDALQRKLEPDAVTYWQAKRQASGPASYFRQS